MVPELGKNPVAICIVHSNRPRQYVVANAVVPNLELTACRVRINEALLLAESSIATWFEVLVQPFTSVTRRLYTHQCVNVYIQYSGW